MKKLLSLLLAMAMLMTCAVGFCLETSAATEQRLNQHSRYGYSFPAPQNVTGDNVGTVLTDGKTGTCAFVTVKNVPKSVNDWSGNSHTLNLFEGKEPHFYVQNDFGFVADVTRVTADFAAKDGAVLPSKVEVFVSNDGYNYALYPAQSVKKNGSSFEIRFSKPVKAKGVKLFVYTGLNKKIAISELSVYVTPNRNKRIFLSKGAKSRWDGSAIDGYADDK